MTDDEFQRIKEEEKRHLRAKKRLQRTLEALKQRNEVRSAVQRMKRGAARLLDETESLVDSLRRKVAQNEARFELALDKEQLTDDDLYEAEEELRDERAEALVRRFKDEQTRSTSSRPRPSGATLDDSTEASIEEDSEQEGPDKTIGRMGDFRSDEGDHP